MDDVLSRTLEMAKRQDYVGYSKHDALNARWLEVLSGWGKWPRLLTTQLVMRSPLHVRPILGVGTARNAKGLSLLARAYLAQSRMGVPDAGSSAAELLDWLIGHPSAGWDHKCWGYPYPWQDVGFFAPRNFPNRVVTSFVCQALLDGYETLGEERFLGAASDAARFLLDAPRTLFEDETRRCVSYVPAEEVNWIVMDVSALAGAVAAKVASHTNDAVMMSEAGRLVRYVVSKQTDYHAWFYTEPPGDSHITHDNYHTGFILDALLDYEEASSSTEFAEAYDKGLEYYATHLFTDEGAPRFMNDQEYPYDIHGCAQGIITFARSGNRGGVDGLALSGKIREWTLSNMYDPTTGWFNYQNRRLFRTRVRLLRWCQAWMARALSVYREATMSLDSKPADEDPD